MALTLVTIKARTRGKNTRDVEYQGVGKFVKEKVEKRDEDNKIIKDADGKPVMVDEDRLVTEGVVPGTAEGLKDAIAVENGNMQSFLDNWAIGYNLNAYKGVSDALAEYIKPAWTTSEVAAFRLIVNNLAKLPGMTTESAAQFALTKMPA